MNRPDPFIRSGLELLEQELRGYEADYARFIWLRRELLRFTDEYWQAVRKTRPLPQNRPLPNRQAKSQPLSSSTATRPHGAQRAASLARTASPDHKNHHAYRTLARLFHPDSTGLNATAAAPFFQLIQALRTEERTHALQWLARHHRIAPLPGETGDLLLWIATAHDQLIQTRRYIGERQTRLEESDTHWLWEEARRRRMIGAEDLLRQLAIYSISSSENV